jgi:hypothetical protein
MAACDISSGHALGCRDNSGGIKAIYILSGSVAGITDTSNEISDISGSGVFYQFDLQRSTSDFSETINGSTENGTVFYEATLNAVFAKMQTSLRNQVKVLAQNPDLKIIAQTNNDDSGSKFIYMGRQNGALLNAGQSQSGTALGDLNGYTLTFTAQEPDPADIITGTTLSAALTGITVSQ